eukprot:gene5631-10847_t
MEKGKNIKSALKDAIECIERLEQHGSSSANTVKNAVPPAVRTLRPFLPMRRSADTHTSLINTSRRPNNIEGNREEAVMQDFRKSSHEDVGHPLHVQKLLQSGLIDCEDERCREEMTTAAWSGMNGTECSHLMLVNNAFYPQQFTLSEYKLFQLASSGKYRVLSEEIVSTCIELKHENNLNKDDVDEVDCQNFWNDVAIEMMSRGFRSIKLDSLKVGPNLSYWPPFMGKKSRIGIIMYNSEHLKAQRDDENVEVEFREISEERLLETLFESSSKDSKKYLKFFLDVAMFNTIYNIIKKPIIITFDPNNHRHPCKSHKEVANSKRQFKINLPEGSDLLRCSLKLNFNRFYQLPPTVQEMKNKLPASILSKDSYSGLGEKADVLASFLETNVAQTYKESPLELEDEILKLEQIDIDNNSKNN